MKRMLSMLLALGLLVAPLANAQSQPLRMAVTVGMIADVAENVGGECVDVTAMMGPGVDPHLYQASASDVTLLRQAELILYSGYSLEGQLGQVLERFGQTKPTVAVAPSSIDPGQLITVQDIYGIDPHLWMDVSLWSQIVPTIADHIIKQRPDCQSTIRDNAQRYRARLEALHGWVRQAVNTIPEAQRILVTAHDAFNYYSRAYGIEVAGIQGISTETESGVADIREMADVVTERQVPAVFIESTINPRTVQAVIDAAKQQGQPVRIGGELFSDAMGEDGTAGGTYIGMLYENTRQIVTALGGTLPPLPDALSRWAGRWELTEAP
ncbi:manganese/zinc/iron transport system substrate-binding protein [Tamilnaduibacter salinus]|uniref:Manganese/zinc/iron transport system substrate-binding protein n=1 Tax=Tamilnaduibacter salinus TaxID=1484056 RepID=A0A2U1CYE0_9GAMM|nr:zinc ABC transporter substrate-binding protein [Tamilnaduibacter salinus]PVY77506.1 manganese/zinc/iron transport system substrate-binding protein [Tamilnaduibacter salinus]